MPPTDEQMDKVIPVYLPPTSLGGGIIKLHVKPWKDIRKIYNWYSSLEVD